MYDYLGLGKSRKDNPTDFLNLKSDYLGLSSFAAQGAKDLGHARRTVKREIRQYKKDIHTIRKEAHGFKKDFEHGGWIGKYIKRKVNDHKHGPKNNRRFVTRF